MSSCSNTVDRVSDKFVIAKDIDNLYVFTIKANGTTSAIEIQPSDTFTAHLRALSDGSTVLTKALTTEDALSGRVNLQITQAETASLESLRGGAEDRYYLKPNYSLTLECNTSVEGEFLAKVPLVYVD